MEIKNITANLFKASGVKILAGHVHVDGIRAELAAYNAGVAARDRDGKGWEFADAVMAIYERIKAQEQAAQSSILRTKGFMCTLFIFFLILQITVTQSPIIL